MESSSSTARRRAAAHTLLAAPVALVLLGASLGAHAEEPPRPPIIYVVDRTFYYPSISQASYISFDPYGRIHRYDARGMVEGTQDDSDSKENCGSGSNGNGTSGNPVVVRTGNKVETEVDFAVPGDMGLVLSRTYNRHWTGIGVFGRHWTSSLDYKLTFGTSAVNSCYPRPGGGTCGIGTNTVIWAHRPEGRLIKFIRNADGTFRQDGMASAARISVNADGSFTLRDEDNSVERYSSAGYVQSVSSPSGIGWTFGYSGTYPTRVTHTSGRYMELVWSGGKVTSVRDPAGNYVGYAYFADRLGAGQHLLSATALPGNPGTTYAYHYELADQPGALTGKTIGGTRYSWFTYSPNGKVLSTEHAGGRDRYTFSYASTGEEKFTTETNPLGRVTEYSYRSGTLVRVRGFATTHCSGVYREATLDANSREDIVSEFDGSLTDYDYNDKGQLLKVIRAAGTPLARTTEYVWDTAANRVVAEVEPGIRRTDYTFDAQQRITSVTVTNLSPHGVAQQARTTTYTYTVHPSGMVATLVVDGPVAGTGDAVTYAFNALGDLTSVSNALGHATTYSNYNGLGQPGRITSQNGAITDYLYDQQGRVVTVRRWVGGAAADTTYAYNAQGLVASVTPPDGAATYYEYDATRRVSRIWRSGNGTVAGGASKEDQVFTYDALGEVVRVEHRKLTGHYETQCKRWMTIEGVPECVQEEQVWVEVPTTTLVRTIDRDQLGRVRAERGNNGQRLQYTYDDGDRIATITDAAGRVTTYGYDALGRLVRTTDPAGAVTQVAYDAADNVVKVTDPNGLHTTYVYDGFGQLWAQSSPDTGLTSVQ